MQKNKMILMVVVVVVVAAGAGLIGSLLSASAARRIAPSTGTATLTINAICINALSYMTFPNGAAADAFVKDCEDGKHPEVIDKYKADHGLGTGAAI